MEDLRGVAASEGIWGNCLPVCNGVGWDRREGRSAGGRNEGWKREEGERERVR